MGADPWRTEFDRRVLAHVAGQGEWVREGREDDQFWEDYGADYLSLVAHMANCPPDPARSSWQERQWLAYQGTFHEGSPYEQGVEAVITCPCGFIRDRRARYDKGYADLIRAITSA